jgi:glycosyltransferase 2 family protein
MLRNWRLWLGLAISAIFIALTVRGQDLGQVRRALGEADYRALPLALALYFAGVWTRALRWRALLAPVKPIAARRLFPVVVIGYMANNILPWRIGEFVRGYILREREGVPTSASLATIAVERIFDGLTMLAFLLAASLVIPLDAGLRRVAALATAIFGVALLALVMIVVSGVLRARLLALVTRPLPGPLAARLTALIESFAGGLHILRSARELVVVAACSIGAWGLESAMYLALAPAFDLPLGPAGALMTTAVANLATLIPSTPGYIGVFETGVVSVVSGVLGADPAVALSYAIVVHAALYFPITLWGLYYWTRAHLSFGAIRARAEREREGVGA